MPVKDFCGGLAALTNLQFLQLSGPYMLPEVLQRLTKVTFLDITCHSFVYIQTSQGVATTIARHSCMHLSALQRLTVLKIAFAKAGGRLTDADRQAVLAQIQQLPVLQHLDLTMAPTKALVYEPGLDETLSELTNLESLLVRNGRLYPGCSLGGLTKLTSLTLDTCMFPADLQLDTRNLQRLRLHQANIQSPTTVVPTGQAAGPSPSAQQEVTPAAVPDLLAAIGKMTRLTYLALEQCQGTGYDLASWPANSFAALTASSSLQELHFTCLDKQVHTDLARQLYVMMFVTAPAAVAVPGLGLLQPQVLVLSSNIQQMIKVPEANIWEHVFPANKPLPALRVLKLHVPCRTVFGSTLANIVANCPSLRSVDLQGMGDTNRPSGAHFHPASHPEPDG